MANAVTFRNASKTYGSGKMSTRVLNHLNMNVPRGAIYGLLGASGCGKTTLLTCIAGRLKLNEGEVKVLGGIPGTKGSGVPGPRIGYMPQEVALVEQMNVGNVIYYFGWLFGMSSSEIAERYTFLSQLLELPDKNRLVKNLSGGQQRRVSFAAALVQTPELLILDEPTVGLDPVLRQNIWDYLVQISRESNMTIIITTHYIEEATQAHKIGLLREGTLLADMAPDVLIAQYSCTTLEEAFLILSRKQVDDEAKDNSDHHSVIEKRQDDVENVQHGNTEDNLETDNAHLNGKKVVFDEISTDELKSNVIRPKFSLISRMKALLYKDLIAIFRNKPGLLFTLLFPAIQIITFYLAIGNDNYGLSLGLINHEISNCDQINSDIRYKQITDNGSCSYYGLSCWFVEKLKEGSVVSVSAYDDKESAFYAAKKLITSGTVYIPNNFSLSLKERIDEGSYATDETLEFGDIKVHLDMSNYLIGYKLKKFILDKFFELTDDFAESCSLTKQVLRLPVTFKTPVYGEFDESFRIFMTSGTMITIVFFLSAMATATTITSERDSGIWNRNLVAGVYISETIFSHILSQLCGMVVQLTVVILISFFVFDLECKGSIATMLALLTLQSFAGIVYGLFVGAYCKNSADAMYATIGSLFPYSFLIGCLWPIEGAPLLYQYVSYIIPGRIPSQALHNILAKGLGWLNPQVYPGFLITIAWIVIPFCLSVFQLRK